MQKIFEQGVIGPIDIAIIEAAAITEDGTIIPTTSVGNSPIIMQHAKEIIIELNVAQPDGLEGIHDIYLPAPQGQREPIPLTSAGEHIGSVGIPVDISKIRGIVLSDITDAPSIIVEPDAETAQIAEHLLNFLRAEIEVGRLSHKLAPLTIRCWVSSQCCIKWFFKFRI